MSPVDQRGLDWSKAVFEEREIEPGFREVRIVMPSGPLGGYQKKYTGQEARKRTVRYVMAQVAAMVPSASHEFMCCALDPEEDETRDPDVAPWKMLRPQNWVHQAAGITDDVAKHIALLIVQRILTGNVSPDSDFSRYWADAIDETVKHVLEGKHPVA